MISIITHIASALTVALITFLAIQEIISYAYIVYYRSQGMKTSYTPIVGSMIMFMKDKGKMDELKTNKEFYNKEAKEGTDIVFFNSGQNQKGVLLLVSPEIVKEFFAKELKFTVKAALLQNVNFGFFWKNGEEMFKSRKVFGQFFLIENLNKITPQIISIVDQHLDCLKLKHWGDEGNSAAEFKKIDWREELDSILAKVVMSILFGENSDLQIDGMPLPSALTHWLKSSFADFANPLNLLFSGMPQKYKLLPSCIRNHMFYKRIEDVCYQFYLKRKKEGPRDDINMMDLMIDMENKGEIVLTKEEIAGNVILLQFAGADTSKETSSTYLKFLANRPDLQAKISQEVQREIYSGVNQSEVSESKFENLDFHSFEKSDYFNRSIEEALRLFAPFPLLSPRDAIKDFTLGGFKILKGTRISVPAGMNHILPENHEDPFEYNPDRFHKANKKKMNKGAYIPFSSGGRICIGRYMGELSLKILISQILRKFELKSIDGHKEKKVFQMVYGFKSSWTHFRPRN